MEPLQMKKRKKGGGYNLRKSLAWDRAFFTEEGVLDPLELSMINGSSKDSLSVINDDFDSGSDCVDLKSVEGTSKKELPSLSLVGDQRNSSCYHAKDSLPCKNASPSSVATRIIPSTQPGRTKIKATRCPRPLPSSTLERPSNMSTTREAGKMDSKVPRMPLSNQIPTGNRNKTSILSESQLKHNQNAQPVVNFHRNIGLKSSSKSCKVVQNKAGNGANYPPYTKSTTHEVSVSENPNSNFLKAQIIYNQPVKPSGLRMPSPSLGFFGQPKATGSHGLLQKATKSSNIPKPLQKTSELKRASKNAAVNSVSNKIMKLDMEVNEAQKPETEVSNGCKIVQPIRIEYEVGDDVIVTKSITQEHKEQNDIVKYSYIEVAKSHMNDSNLLLQSGSCRQSKMTSYVSNPDFEDMGSYDKMVNYITNLDKKFIDQSVLSEEYEKVKSRENRKPNDEISEGRGSELSTQDIQESSRIGYLSEKSKEHSELNFSCIDQGELSKEFQRTNSGEKRKANEDILECRGSYLGSQETQEISTVGYLIEQSEEHLEFSKSSIDQAELLEEFQKAKSREKRKTNKFKKVAQILECRGSELGSQEIQESSRFGYVSEPYEEHLDISKSFIDQAESSEEFQKDKSREKGKSNDEISECSGSELGSHSQEIHESLRFGYSSKQSEEHLEIFLPSTDQAESSEEFRKTKSGEKTNNNEISECSGSVLGSQENQESSRLVYLSEQSEEYLELSKCCIDQAELSVEIQKFKSEVKRKTNNEISECSGSEFGSQKIQESSRIGCLSEQSEDLELKISCLDDELQNNHHSENEPKNEQLDESKNVRDDEDSLKSSDSGTKMNKIKIVYIKPPADAVPFSDEWLAAIEAAGEDILTMKGGAVQNSPTDKSQPEPSPWSPVKRKNNLIGPFDCTKCINTLPADD